MTTIAWDGRTLAADSQSQSGDVICSVREPKLFKPKPGEEWTIYGEKVVAIGTSGDCGAEMEIMDVLRDGGLSYKSQFLPTFQFTALLIISAGRAYIASKDKGETAALISLQLDPYAIGSGGLIARTAMHLRHNAIEAVQTAIELDLCSGGRVDSITFGEQSSPFIIVRNQE